MARTAVSKPAPRDHQWAEAVAGPNIDTPSDGLKASGYTPPAIPTLEDFNYFLGEMEQHLRYYIERGLPDWDAAETYQVGDIVRIQSVPTTIFLVCVVVPAVGLNPLTNFDLSNRYWERWMYSPFGSSHTATDDTPIARWHNNVSFNGNGVDRLGFINGVGTQNLVEVWRGTETVSSTGASSLEKTSMRWITGLTGSGSNIFITAATSSIAAQHAALQNGTGQATLVSEVVSSFDDSVDCALEGVVLTDTGVTLQRMSYGIADGGGNLFGATNGFIGAVFYKGNGDANWQCVTGDGTTLGTPIDSGVAVIASTRYLFRVEWIGSTMADNGVRCARFYINGNLVGTSTAHLPNGGGSQPLSVVLATEADTGSTSRIMYMLPQRFSSRF